MNQGLAGALSFLVVVAGVTAANLMFDRKTGHYVSRKAGHLSGGVAALIMVLWMDFWPAFVLASGAALGLVLLRLWQPHSLRGIGGTGRPHAYAEVTYALAIPLSLAVGWGVFGDRWLSFLPIAYLAFGDSVTGLVRSAIYKKEVKGWWGSAAMGVVCLLLAALYPVYWIGAAGAVAATLAERFSPIAHGWLDDNLILTSAALAVMLVLKELV